MNSENFFYYVLIPAIIGFIVGYFVTSIIQRMKKKINPAELEGRLSILEVRLESLNTHILQLRQLINEKKFGVPRKKAQNYDDDEGEELSANEKAWIATLPPHEQAAAKELLRG